MIYKTGALSNHPGDLLSMLTIGEDGILKAADTGCLVWELNFLAESPS